MKALGIIGVRRLSDSKRSSMKGDTNISGWVRGLRTRCGLTQEQFAAKLGVTFPTINRWENQRASPSPLALLQLQNLERELGEDISGRIHGGEEGAGAMSGLRSSPLVLVVDDDVTLSLTLQGILAGAGFRTASTANVAGAWDRIHDQRPDLVLLDVNLPDGNGFDLCQRLKAEPGMDRMPVLFISANDELGAKVRGFDVGGVDYISKPLAGAEVLARVGTHLRLKRAYEALAELQAERLERLASAQQTTMPQPGDLPGARFEVALKQRLQAGGDFYDVIPSGEGCVDYLVADASGHDLGASCWTAALKALVMEYASPLNAPVDVMRALNRALGRLLPSGAFFTLIYARLNRHNLRLSLVNAGHPPAILAHREAQEVEVVQQEGDVVGAFPDPVFGVTEMMLHRGDRLFLYSDGVVEQSGPAAVGVQRLAAACRAGAKRSLAEVVPAVLEEVTAGEAALDDMLLLGVEA